TYIGRVGAVRHGQNPTRTGLVGGKSKCGVVGDDVGEIQNVVSVKTAQHTAEIGGVIDLQGAGGRIIEQNILAEGAAEFEENRSVDQGRAAATDISAYGDVAVIGPQQPIIHQVAMDEESAAVGCFQSTGIDHRVCARIDRKRVGAGCDDGAIIYQHHLA